MTKGTFKTSMRRAGFTYAFVVAVTMIPIVAQAQLIGSSVTGTLTSPPSGSPNYFDPAHGYVPPGYPNSSGPTVTIAGGVEFAFLQGGGTVTAPGLDSFSAAFSGSTLTLSENISTSSPHEVEAVVTTFVDSAFSGLTITKTSDTFANGGANATLVGNTLTITLGPQCGNAPCSWPTAQSAEFSLTAQPAPASISSLQPNSLDAGSAAFTLTVNGSGFVSGDTVEWNSVPLTTTYVSASKLMAKVSAAEVAVAGSAAVTVDTATGHVATKPALFSIPVTSITVASQTIKAASGGYSITLTLKNSGFNAATELSITGANLATAATSTVFPIDITSIAPNATKTVTLTFPSSAGKAGTEVYLLLYGSYTGEEISLSSVETLP